MTSFCAFFSGALASRVKRKDTLALKLSSRPCAPDRDRFTQERVTRDDHPPGHNNLTWQSREQWEAIRTQIGTALTRLKATVIQWIFSTLRLTIEDIKKSRVCAFVLLIAWMTAWWNCLKIVLFFNYFFLPQTAKPKTHCWGAWAKKHPSASVLFLFSNLSKLYLSSADSLMSYFYL